jgi:hypothetical protein
MLHQLQSTSASAIAGSLTQGPGVIELPQIQRPARYVTKSRRRLVVVTPSEFSLCCLGTLRAHEAEVRRCVRGLVKQNGAHAGALCASSVS